MGDTGPCGPVLRDPLLPWATACGRSRRALRARAWPATATGWLEIWNLVFMQFERKRPRTPPLDRRCPRPSIDTGAGLERVAAVIQGKRSNYDTDLFARCVDRAATLSGKALRRHRTTTTSRCASSPTTPAPPRSSSPTASSPSQRGPRLRAAAHHAPRDPPRRPPGARGAASSTRSAQVVVVVMGAAYPELRERRELDRSSVAAEEEALPPHPRPRPAAHRRGD